MGRTGERKKKVETKNRTLYSYLKQDLTTVTTKSSKPVKDLNNNVSDDDDDFVSPPPSSFYLKSDNGATSSTKRDISSEDSNDEPRHKIAKVAVENNDQSEETVSTSRTDRQSRFHFWTGPDEPEFLTKSQIDLILDKYIKSIHNNSFVCNVKDCVFRLKSQAAPNQKRRKVKKHLTRHLLEDVVTCLECGKGFKQKGDLDTHFYLVHQKSFLCDFDGCSHMAASPLHLARHKESIHIKSLPFECLMPSCDAKFSQEIVMLEHFFFHCIMPDWLFCKDCKFRCHTRPAYNDHWSDPKHIKNVELLKSHGIQPASPPTFNLNDEIKKAKLNPVAYKAQHFSAHFLGVSTVPIFPVKGTVENVEAFRGYIPHSGILPRGSIWCSEAGVPTMQQCHSSMLHNQLCGPHDFINIPVPVHNSLIDFVTYQVPILSTTDCTTEVFTYILLCRKHTKSSGTRGVGMSLDLTSRDRFGHYRSAVKALSAAREN